jgi:hypothetical protein
VENANTLTGSWGCNNLTGTNNGGQVITWGVGHKLTHLLSRVRRHPGRDVVQYILVVDDGNAFTWGMGVCVINYTQTAVDDANPIPFAFACATCLGFLAYANVLDYVSTVR